MSQTRKETNAINILSNISTGKGNQAIKDITINNYGYLPNPLQSSSKVQDLQICV